MLSNSDIQEIMQVFFSTVSRPYLIISLKLCFINYFS